MAWRAREFALSDSLQRHPGSTSGIANYDSRNHPKSLTILFCLASDSIMSRWPWITLAALILTLVWLGLGSSNPAQLAAVSTNGVSNCPLPKQFRQADSPMQSDVANGVQKISLGDSSIVPLAGFSLQARVLAREDYSFDAGAEFSPVDLALGWGPMAKPGMTEKLNVTQSSRWYRYSWDGNGPPIPLDEIISHSANMHMVPASNAVAESLKQVSEDDVIELNGWLIRIEKENGWRWQSSLSRDDSGDGACELVYVCSIQIKNP